MVAPSVMTSRKLFMAAVVVFGLVSASFWTPMALGFAAAPEHAQRVQKKKESRPEASSGKSVCDGVGEKELAQELLRLLFSGAYYPDKSTCLDQKDFPHVLAVHEPPSEVGTVDVISIEDSEQPKLEKTTPKGSGGADTDGEFIAQFSVKAAGKTHTDSFGFVIYHTPKKRKLRGCAAILLPPKGQYIWKRCRP